MFIKGTHNRAPFILNIGGLKMHVKINCNECRKKMLHEALRQYAEQQYDIYEDTLESAADWSCCIALSVLERMGATSDDIKSFFDDFVFIADMPELFGKKITADDTMKRLEERYGIDFERIKIHTEAKNTFINKFLKASE